MADRPMYPVEPDILRFKLQQRYPYFHSVLYSLKPTLVEGLGTFAVDVRGRWYYDKEVPFTQDEQIFGLYHEINHLIRGHLTRQGAREVKQWNFAGDCEINDDPPPGMVVPTGILFPKTYKLPNGELAEWYYDRINQREMHYRVDATAMDAGTGPCQTVPGCSNKDVEPVLDKKTFDILTKGISHIPRCGAVSQDNGNGDSERQDGDISEVEMEAIKKQVAEDIKAAGDAPGSLERWADGYLNPKVDWRKLLRTVARRAAIVIQGHTDLTYQRMARRNIRPFILPKRIAHQVTVAFYVDTSGSIGEEELKQAMSEVLSAVRLTRSGIYVTFVDAQVYEPTVFVTSPGQVNYITPKGGGGTDMRLCFQHFKTLKAPKPNLCVILTDGYTPWPAENPGYQTIVVLNTHANTYKDSAPEWAKVVRMD